MAELILYGESTWQSPWVFHVMVALEELGVGYELVVVPIPMSAERRAELHRLGVAGKVPMLVDGELAVAESSAISEYLFERFPPPTHPALLPTTRADRARARQLMSMLRTSLFALREDRPTSSVFERPVDKPLSDAARRDAAELARVVEAVLPAGASHLFGAWSIADADVALALMRLVANGDPLPQRLVDYALAQWSRASVRKYISYVPTTP
jgi:glutathione S-transferase